MSRAADAKIRITGELVAEVPLSVGGTAGGDPASGVDMDLARDGRGRFYIPGSSLVGPMRAWVELNLEAAGEGMDGCWIANRFFGDEHVKGGGDKGAASPFFVDDAVLKDGSAERERRHGIAIQAETGTVGDKLLFTRALLPAGSVFPVEMELELAGTESEKEIKEGALRQLLEALCDGRIRFGSGKTRGFGAMKLENMSVDYFDFTGAAGGDALDALARWLRGEDAARRGLESLPSSEDSSVALREARSFRVEIAWHPASKIMVKSGRDGHETDMMPLVSAARGGGSVPVIPGSSLKGVLRSQACRIMRTIGGDDAHCLDIVEDLFGGVKNAGRLFIDDVYSLPDEPPSGDAWLAEDAESLDRITARETHVAIDRFTGGASSGALYSARPVKSEIKWSPIRLCADFSARSETPDEATRLAELALIWLLVRDLREGYVPVGFGTRRGLGDVAVDDVTWPADFPDRERLRQAWESFLESGYALRMEEADRKVGGQNG